MHRGGTSVTAGALVGLGISPGKEGLLKSPSPVNPAGFWEQRRLNRMNDDVLERLGGSWLGPPTLRDGWQKSAELVAERHRAAELFADAFPEDPWVWKDPRNCLTLPFWIAALDLRPVVVLVTRDPLEIVASLTHRDRTSKPYGLALWERYLRSALAACPGLPVLVTSLGDLLSRPAAWARRAIHFLEAQGICPPQSNLRDATAAVDLGLHHHRAAPGDFRHDPLVSPEQKALAARLRRTRGPHAAFTPPALPAETPHTAWLIDERRNAERELRELREKLKQEAKRANRAESRADALRAESKSIEGG